MKVIASLERKRKTTLRNITFLTPIVSTRAPATIPMHESRIDQIIMTFPAIWSLRPQSAESHSVRTGFIAA